MERVFRKLTPDDIESAVSLVVACYDEEWRASTLEEFSISFSDDYYRPDFFGVFEQGEMLSIIATMRSGFMVNLRSLSWVNVKPSHQGQGIGAYTVNKLCEYAKTEYFKNGQGSLILTTKPENKSFYIKLGFAEGSAVHDGEIVMTKVV